MAWSSLSPAVNYMKEGWEQARHLGVRILEAQVLGVGGFDTFTVKTTEGDFDTVSVILATGGKRSTPKIPGIQEFEGRGVSYCAVCDAFFYRGKEVAVLGIVISPFMRQKNWNMWLPELPLYTDGKRTRFFQRASHCSEYYEDRGNRGRRQSFRYSYGTGTFRSGR